MKIRELLNERLVDYASYDNLRKIASCVDGFKNASRKVMYTIHEKKIKEKTKVLQLANKCAEFSDYLHGSLDGVVVTLGQDYTGTNNIPLLQKFGNFGTRSVNEASAPRYIFAKGSDAFFELFRYEDDEILEKQVFEGYPIEPRFYVPTLPVLLINGSEGVSSGFAQKVLPRNPENIKKYINAKLQGKPTRNDWLNPWFRGFNGSVNKDTDVPGKWYIKGLLECISGNCYLIKEIPYQYDLRGYIDVLDALLESKKITKYKDESDGENKLQFRVWLPKGLNTNLDSLYEHLKLVKPITENYTCVDEENKIKVFNTVNEIIDYYIEVKKKYVLKRKNHYINKYNSDLDILLSKKLFITLYINNNIKINNIKKDEIINQLKAIKEIVNVDNYNYLLNMPIYSLTLERIESLDKDIKNLRDKMENLKSSTVEDIWIDDLSKIKL